MSIRSANPHAAEQVVPADELVIQSRADMQGDETHQERPARCVDHLPGAAGAVEGLRDAPDTPELGKVSALQRHDQP